ETPPSKRRDAMAKIVTDNTLAILAGKQPEYIVNA
ncbi:Putative 2-hydroxyacid dehydrogenase, partial [Lacticaseibacillus paracasei subsp. paracasei Lpp126]